MSGGRPAGKHSVAALLLAAGVSRRFGDANKLLTEIDGETLVRRVARTILAAHVSTLIVVTGHDKERVKEALAALDVSFVHAKDYAEGIAASLRRGVAAVPAAAAGVVICLADMPGLSAQLIDRLIGAFQAERGRSIVFPEAADGRQGNPVVWPRALFPELMSLKGDRGGKALLEAHRDKAVGIAAEDVAAFADIDTRDDLARWRPRA